MKIKNIHFMGISGSGMKGVSSLAVKMKYKVSGCDLSKEGHNIKHLKNIDLLVVSPAVLYQNKSEPELLQGLRRKIVMTWEEFVGKYLMKDKFVIAIAGTHGKSTTTAMVAKILIDNGFDPSVVIGAYVPEWKGNSRFGKSKYFVIEADEFNNNFLHYQPQIAVINNIEFDHPDYFRNEEQVKESFEKFKKNLVGERVLFTQHDSKNIKFNLTIFGEHNQQNANMAYLVGRQLKIKKEEIIKSLESFRGIGRRMELIGEVNKIKVFDDYAHHPTAIKTTLAGLRQKYPEAKILAIIEPHGYKRTKALLPLYQNCFKSVDKVIIGPIFKARDKVDRSTSIEDIAKISGHKNVEVFEDAEKLIENCKLTTKSSELIANYDIVVVMGAGNSNTWAKKLLKSLQH